MSIDLEEQYDKVYRYCYMKIQHQQTAEDITQETFLRFLENKNYKEMGKRLAYLYTIARNLCMDHFRRKEETALKEDIPAEDREDRVLQSIVLKHALSALDLEGQELIFLRYVNEISVGQICEIMGISRFAVYRKTKECLNKLKQELGKEEWL